MKQISLGAGIVNYPMPIALIGTVRDGRANFMTAAWFSMVSYQPARIAVSLGGHLTSDSIQEAGVFSICIPSANRLADVDYCGMVSGRKADKSEVFTVFTGKTGAPMAEECLLNVECRLSHMDVNGMDTTYIGDIVDIYADRSVLTDGKVNLASLNPLILSQQETKYYTLAGEADRAWSAGRRHR